MNDVTYRPTSAATPQPRLLPKLSRKYCYRWVPVTEALPPERLSILVIVRGDNCPAYGWLKFAAGDKTWPYFVVPQLAAMKPRNVDLGQPDWLKGRTDITCWFSPGPTGLPDAPAGFENAAWGLGWGWEKRNETR